MNTKRLMLKFVAGAAGFLAALPGTTPLLAHHSFQAQYDESMPVTLMGTVTKVIWKNPHVQVNLDVKDADGSVKNWLLELNSPNALMSQGWKVDSIKQGDQITATGFRARDGSNYASARKVTLASR